MANMIDRDPTPEKESARWERVTGTLEDLREMCKVHERYLDPEISDDDIRISSDNKELEGQFESIIKGGEIIMLLRRGNRSIGYLIVRPRPIKEYGMTLSISALEMATKEIDLSIAGKLIDVLKSCASEVGTAYISWTIGPSRAGIFSDKIGAQEIDDGKYILPIEKLDRRGIFQSIKTWREKVKSEPQNQEEGDVDYE